MDLLLQFQSIAGSDAANQNNLTQTSFLNTYVTTPYLFFFLLLLLKALGDGGLPRGAAGTGGGVPVTRAPGGQGEGGLSGLLGGRSSREFELEDSGVCTCACVHVCVRNNRVGVVITKV